MKIKNLYPGVRNYALATMFVGSIGFGNLNYAQGNKDSLIAKNNLENKFLSTSEVHAIDSTYIAKTDSLRNAYNTQMDFLREKYRSKNLENKTIQNLNKSVKKDYSSFDKFSRATFIIIGGIAGVIVLGGLITVAIKGPYH